MNDKPVITLVGAGSLFFGRKAIWAMAHLSGLRGGTLRLVDTDPKNLERMERLGEMAMQSAGVDSRIEAFTDFRKALPGSDFVVLSFSKDNAHYRRIDCEVSARFGIRMCSGDTIGPGGVFRTLREFTPIMEIASAVEELCPKAWLINYVNPTATFGLALMRHFKGRYFALCDAQHLPYFKENRLKMIGEDPGRHPEFEVKVAGVNHFTFMTEATLAGENVLPRLLEAHRERGCEEKDGGYAKGRFNHFITAQLGDVFGALPTVVGHTKEYVPYYQGRTAMQEPIPPLSVFDCDERDEWTTGMWQEIDAYLEGKEPIEKFHQKYGSDHATDIINTMVTEDGRRYFINVPNRAKDGAKPVSNLPEDAFLELECRLDRKGPDPVSVGPLPIGLRGQQQMVLDCHELTVEACVRKDRNLLLRALAMDPLVNSIATAEAVINALYEREVEAMEPWVKG